MSKPEGEHLGRNIRRQLEKRAQPEDLAPCGDPHCAGCYDVGECLPHGPRVRIHPPRSEYGGDRP
jgi:hypothetical protein